MVASEAQLCNVALLRVGERQLIDSLEQDTTPSRTCRALYSPARDALLEEHWWSFATKRVVLALTPETRDGWGFVYATPADCLVPRYLWSGLRNPPAAARVAFSSELKGAADGFNIATDAEAPVLVYTARITSVGLFSALFVDALAWRLAIDLALGLAVKPQVGLALEAKYQRSLAKAVAADLRLGEDDELPESELISVRS